jgi:Mn-containing catalase
MWSYEKRLQYPVKIKNTNPKLAQIVIAQYGGPDGNLLCFSVRGRQGLRRLIRGKFAV